LDAQLSPRLTWWIQENFAVECLHIRDLGLRDAEESKNLSNGARFRHGRNDEG
jgi:predicted nuclease of predicted toxin-antitoxin system